MVTESYGSGANAFSAATGSPGDLGLLRELGLAFAGNEDARLDWMKAGSGQALDALRAGRVDMVMVHAPAAEKQAVAEGWAVGRTLIGSNEFFVVGPPADPAGIATAGNAAEAYGRIAAARARFISRGDDSGTHRKELSLWAAAGVRPGGDWYVAARSFMNDVLARAEAEGGYTMADSSVWAAAKRSLPGLAVLFRGDRRLVNTYHALAQPVGATPGAAMAARFIAFAASEHGQRLVREYGKKTVGAALYDDAAYAGQYED